VTQIGVELPFKFRRLGSTNSWLSLNANELSVHPYWIAGDRSRVDCARNPAVVSTGGRAGWICWCSPTAAILTWVVCSARYNRAHSTSGVRDIASTSQYQVHVTMHDGLPGGPPAFTPIFAPVMLASH